MLHETLPASWYWDPDVWERERAAIFAREWLLLARAGQLAVPGSYVAADVCGWPLVVVAVAAGDEGRADGDLVLRGFHNVCRHRAGPLVWPGEGRCTSLVCRYHGWVYGLDGCLRSARDFGDAPPGEVRLEPVRVETWRGLVFVNLWADAPPLLDALGSFADECAAFPMESLQFAGDVSHDVAANWKTYADNYGEGYHIPLVHPELNRQIDARRYTVSVRTDGRYAVHDAPSRAGSPTTGKWLWRFPNLALNLYPDGMNVERFVPLGPRRMRVEYSYFFADLSSPEAVAANADAMRLSAELLEEDRRICEAVQRGLEAGSYTTGVLSPKHEGGVAYFQQLVREALA